MDFYTSVLRPLLFLFDGERAHRFGMAAASLCNSDVFGGVVSRCMQVHDERLSVDIAGIRFAAPLGIAAGFDKEGEAIGFAQSIGASHIEVGTVTLRPQRGNPRPRVFRIPDEEAIVNRMGFPSSGVDAVLGRLDRWSKRERTIRIGINIGKNKETPISDAVDEYARLTALVAPFADYVCINVSSPNTPDLRTLQEPSRLCALLAASRAASCGKPLFVKLSPDIEPHDLEAIVGVIVEQKIDAVVATNTTISREACPAARTFEGGLSGAPIFERSCDFVSQLYRHLGGAAPIVGVGGIDSSERAVRMLSAGARALQMYTGLVFKGPSVVSQIHHGIAKWLEDRGFKSIEEIVGQGNTLVGL